jgi:hypothetical protein
VSPTQEAGDRRVVIDLERRYARWAALFYPARYRRERGSELVDTYLALAAPGRRRPSAVDVADLAAGGLRQHLRAAPDLERGFRLAGALALMMTTAFATGWTVFDAFAPTPPWVSPVGPFLSIGVVAWVAWMLAGIVYVAAPGRWSRWATGAAMLVTAGVVPVAAITGLHRPPLVVLLSQLVLGVVAVAADRQPSWPMRLLPVAASVLSALLAVRVLATQGGDYADYYPIADMALPLTALLLLIATTMLALGQAVRRDFRGAWALLILLTPIGVQAVQSLGAALDASGAIPSPLSWCSPTLLALALVAVIGPALIPLVLTVRSRLSRIGLLPAEGARR